MATKVLRELATQAILSNDPELLTMLDVALARGQVGADPEVKKLLREVYLVETVMKEDKALRKHVIKWLRQKAAGKVKDDKWRKDRLPGF